MAFRNFDTTGNENRDVTLAKFKAMFRELYSGAVSALTVGTGTKTATSTAAAATLNQSTGTITTEAVTTAAAAAYTLTLTNSVITANSKVFASVASGTNTTPGPVIGQVKPGAGSATIEVRNVGAAALNGTLAISFLVVN